MNLLGMLRPGAIFLGLAIGLTASASPPVRKPWTEFGDINCEAEMALLDNFAIQLQNSPSAKGVVIFYGGRLFRGRLPRRGEAAARAARIKPYLVQRRGVPANQVIVIDGGFKEDWIVELLVIAPEAALPVPYPTIPAKEIKFRKGKARARDFRCQI
jgi:hypothetical protein